MLSGEAGRRAGAKPAETPAARAAIILTPYGFARQRRRAKWVQRELDYQLDKLKGAKRLGLLWLSLGVLFVAVVLAPAFLVWRTPETGPKGAPAFVAQAASQVSVKYAPLPFETIDPDLQRALVVLHDPAFCFDGAVLRRTAAAQAFLWPEPNPEAPSPFRAWLAGYLAGYMDLFWDKQKTLAVFANTAVWSSGLIGVEAAAQARLGQSASALDAEAGAIPLALGQTNPSLLRASSADITLRQITGAMAAQIAELEAAQAFYCLAPIEPTTNPQPTRQGRGAISRP